MNNTKALHLPLSFAEFEGRRPMGHPERIPYQSWIIPKPEAPQVWIETAKALPWRILAVETDVHIINGSGEQKHHGPEYFLRHFLIWDEYADYLCRMRLALFQDGEKPARSSPAYDTEASEARIIRLSDVVAPFKTGWER